MAYNRIEREISMEMLAEKNNFSAVLNQAEYLSQASQKIEGSLEEIRQKKDELAQQQNQLQQEKE
jgi:prefoldin subunit 5